MLLVPALSPLTAVASLLANPAVQAASLIGLTVGVIAVLRRRWFCRWVCPMGTCADGASRVGLLARRRCPGWPTLGGAVLGYPMLLWLAPLALFAATSGVAHDPSATVLRFGALGFAIILLVSVVWPTVWCARICPLGGFQDGLASLVRLPGRARQGATRVAHRGEGLLLSRRLVLGVLAGLGFSAATRSARASAPRPLRPPGALDNARFIGVCIRCGNCLRACPADIIRLDPGNHSPAGLLAPMLDFAADYCREDCTLCTEVCPSGALQKIVLTDKAQARIGLPQVDMSVCLLGEARDCAVCRTWCPYEAIRYVFCEDPDVYTLVPHIDPEKCNGCGACQAKCPTKPARAIVVKPRRSK